MDSSLSQSSLKDDNFYKTNFFLIEESWFLISKNGAKSNNFHFFTFSIYVEMEAIFE